MAKAKLKLVSSRRSSLKTRAAKTRPVKLRSARHKTKPRKAAFLLQHAQDAPFVSGGLRSFWEYRDLGIESATGGRYSAQIIRAKQSGNESTGIHFHTPDVQFFYVLKGWFKAEYRGQGVVTVEAGDCLHNPPGNPHNVFAYSDDLEMLEITAPAQYGTVDVESVEGPVRVKHAAKGA
jgi:mannose-6-phosphate isomerase-like protein (cupin superfamily)